MKLREFRSIRATSWVREFWDEPGSPVDSQVPTVLSLPVGSPGCSAGCRWSAVVCGLGKTAHETPSIVSPLHFN